MLRDSNRHAGTIPPPYDDECGWTAPSKRVVVAITGKTVRVILNFEKFAGCLQMVYRIARFLQLAGMLILPIAIAGEVLEKIKLKPSLMLSSLGVLVFIIGWALQQFVKPK